MKKAFYQDEKTKFTKYRLLKFVSFIVSIYYCYLYNSMHDSYAPLGGMIPMLLMQLGEVVFGGIVTPFVCITLIDMAMACFY